RWNRLIPPMSASERATPPSTPSSQTSSNRSRVSPARTGSLPAASVSRFRAVTSANERRCAVSSAKRPICQSSSACAIEVCRRSFTGHLRGIRRGHALPRVRRRAPPLVAYRLQQESRGFLAGEILLPGDQVAVSDGEAAPEPGLNVIGADLLQFV